MHVAFDGSHQNFSGVFIRRAAGQFFGLHERHEIGHGLFHDAGGFDDLRQKHFSGAEQIADDVHASHQRPFDDQDRFAVFLSCFLDVGVNEIHDAFHQRVRKSFLDGAFAPFVLDDFRFALLFDRFGKFNQPLRRVRPAIQQNILD